jgi:cyclopropane-fatty-acyl-phospholipid synthase
VVEIGTGWGGFALHAAQHYGCHVTTTTISAEQHALAAERVRVAGLQDKVTLLMQDYRDLQGQFDKLVSIEMIEAIGAEYLDTYMATLQRLLKPDGVALLQAITIEDHRYEQARRSVDYIKRYVFPGSFIPSINAIMAGQDPIQRPAADRPAGFRPLLRTDPARLAPTLPGPAAAVQAQGFDARFCRLWEFYLAYCEGGFLERSIGVSHLLLARPGIGPLAHRARRLTCAGSGPICLATSWSGCAPWPAPGAAGSGRRCWPRRSTSAASC